MYIFTLTHSCLRWFFLNYLLFSLSLYMYIYYFCPQSTIPWKFWGCAQVIPHKRYPKIKVYAFCFCFFVSMKYISLGNPPGTTPHFKDGTQGKLDSFELKDNATICSLRAQHVTCRNWSWVGRVTTYIVWVSVLWFSSLLSIKVALGWTFSKPPKIEHFYVQKSEFRSSAGQ